MTGQSTSPITRSTLAAARALRQVVGITGIAAGTMLVTSCTQEPDPVVAITQVVHEFSAAISKNDFTGARLLACGTMAADLAHPDDKLRDNQGPAELMGLRTELTKVATPHLDGDRAYVPITVKYTGTLPRAAELTRDYVVDMQKGDSGWKICSYTPAAHP